MNSAKSIKFLKFMRWTLYGVAIAFLVISIFSLVKNVWCYGLNDTLARSLIEIIGVLVAIIGVNMLYDKFKEKQDEAIFGFYIHMSAYLNAIKMFLGPCKRLPKQESDFNYKDASVFVELLDETVKGSLSRDSSESAVKQIKVFCKQFYDFLLDTKDNIPPTSDIKGWYENMEVLSDFLVFGIICGDSFCKQYSDTDCRAYHAKVVKSIVYISDKINNKIVRFHDERN